MQKKTKYRQTTITCRSGRWGGQIIKFEKKSFGWREEGYETGQEVDGIDEKGNIKKHSYKDTTFSRPSPYTSNFLFILTETLSKIVSVVRRVLLALLPLAVIVLIVGACMGEVFGDIMPTVFGAVLGVYFGIIFLSFFLGFLGRIWKKVFRIEEKLEEAMTDAGYEYYD